MGLIGEIYCCEVVVVVGAAFATGSISTYLGGGMSSNLIHLTGLQYFANKLLITSTAIDITMNPKPVKILPAKNTLA